MEEMTQPEEASSKVVAKSRWRQIAALALSLLVIFSFTTLWRSSTNMWTKQSGTFFKSEKPYGAGDFRINGERVISVKVSLPEITFKPRTDSSSPTAWGQPAEVTEPWMNDVGERKNRSIARFLVGTVNGALRTTFKEAAQHAAWWTSDDWSTQLIATTWTDYKLALAQPKAPVVSVNKLFRSVDAGESWVQLKWPKDEQITAIRFIDSSRGYAFGKGPKVWRTTSGGKEWHPIPLRAGTALISRTRGELGVSVLAADNALWFADSSSSILVPGGETRVFSLPWVNKDELTPKESEPIELLHIPGKSVIDMRVREATLWLIACTNELERNVERSGHEKGCGLFAWQAGELRSVKKFAPEVSPGALFVLDNGTLVVDATIDSGGTPRDVIYLSRDGGNTWIDEVEGAGAQGVYMNGKTGDRWRLVAHSLYKRTVK